MLTTILLAPLVAMLVVLVLPPHQQSAIKVVSAIGAGITLVLSLYIAYDFLASGLTGFQYREQIPWISDLGITYHLGVDGLGMAMVLLTAIVIFTGVFVSWKIDYRAKEFFALLLLLVTGVFGVFMSLDLFFFFFFYELAVLPMYLLIGVWGSTRKEYAAMKLVLMLLAGSILVWTGLLALYVQSGINSFDFLRLREVHFSREFQTFWFPFFFVGFGVLAGLWPFHTWSPDGHVAAPTAVSMLHAGVLMKLGAFGIIRVGLELLPEAARLWTPFFIILGTINVLYGAFSAMAQRDLKFVIGYSSVSHMGYVIVGISALTATALNGAMLQMFSHGIMTALFFALVGAIYDQAHTREIAAFGGLARRMPIVAAYFTVAGLASLGLPGLSGFVAEALIFLGTFQYNWIFGILAVFGVVLTATYILRLLARAFYGPLNPAWTGLRDALRSEAFAMTILVLTLVVVGVYPRLLTDPINTTVAPLIERVGGLK
ncbi:MAG: NADH-quinone oxidoreductase subunit M [Chloroflexota bacterium]